MPALAGPPRRTAQKDLWMQHEQQHYVNGTWTAPLQPVLLDVVDPSTEEPFTRIAVGGPADVDRAVAAARAAFPAFARTSRKERLDLLRAMLAEYAKRRHDIADALAQEMGAPIRFGYERQSAAGVEHLKSMIDVLESYRFEEMQGSTLIVREPIGVAGLITPWNWPINQIVSKIAPAIAGGCTMVLKPSEIAPLSAIIWSEAMEAAGVRRASTTWCRAPATSSARPCRRIRYRHDVVHRLDPGRRAARPGSGGDGEAGNPGTRRQVRQHLLPDVDFEVAVRKGVLGMMGNSGQSCNVPTRMFVPADRHDEAKQIAKATTESLVVGDVRDQRTDLGPVAGRAQFNKIQRLIRAGIEEGAELVTGGLGRPDQFNRGYYVRPTVFGGVRNDMTIAREEIFGPVICILPYRDEADAIRMANDTPYGLAAYIQSADLRHARRVAAQMRAGNVFLNYPPADRAAPFGGYKQSGNGRERGRWGIDEYQEIKAIVGYGAA